MNFSQFKNSLDNGECQSIYLLEGEDAYFRERGLSYIKDKFIEEPSINMAVFSGESFDVEDFISSIYSYPLMSRYRLTVIREYYPKSDSIPKSIIEFFNNPPKESILVIVNANGHDYFKKYQSVAYIDCAKGDNAVLARWIKGTLNKENIEIDLETAGILREYCLSDMTRIENEVNKLICYAKEEGIVTKETLDNTVTRSTEYKIYEMTDFIAKKQTQNALLVISDMIAKGDKPQHIISSIYNYFRRLLYSAISKKSATELAKYFNVKEYAVIKIMAQAKMFKIRSLKKTVDFLIDADYKIKSGTSNEFEEMWLIVFKILTE